MYGAFWEPDVLSASLHLSVEKFTKKISLYMSLSDSNDSK